MNNCKTDFFKRIDYDYLIFFSTILTISAVLIVSLMFMIHASPNQSTSQSTSSTENAMLEIIGLPPGSTYLIRLGPLSGLTNRSLNITSYTDIFQISMNMLTANTLNGNVLYEPGQNSISYNGMNYIINNAVPVSNVISLSKPTILYFSTSFNSIQWSTEWNSQQSNALEAIGVNPNSPINLGLIHNQTATLPYGSLYSNAKPIPAGSDKINATYNSIYGSVQFNKFQVSKNQSYSYIQLSSRLFNETLTKPGSYHLPVAVYNGCWGLNDCAPLNITVKLISHLVQGNRVPFNALIQAGSNTILSFSDNTMGSVSITKTFSLSPTEPYNFTFEGLGNQNYSLDDPVVSPANILYYIPINIINTQSVAVSANTPLAIGVSSNGNIIGFNAIPFSSYLASNLMNTEFFYANGTIIPSWLEGNVLNEQSTALSTSANVLWWVNLGANTVNELPASMTIPYTIYLGIASTSTNLLNGVSTGEAPQLSCANPAATATCSDYAEYDNGNNVFSFYSDFAGTTLSSKWHVNGITYTINNGITLIGSSTIANAEAINATTRYAAGNVFEALSTTPSTYDGSFTIGGFMDNVGNDSIVFLGQTQEGCNVCGYDGNGGIFYTTNYPPDAFGIYSMLYNVSDHLGITYQTYTDPFFSIYVHASGLLFPELGAVYYGGVSFASNEYTQWYRVRTAPPKDIMPTTSEGSMAGANNALLADPITPYSPTLDSGQSVNLISAVSGGTTPYSYQWYTASSSSGLCSSSDTAISGATSANYLASPTSTTYYCYIVTDSATPNAVSGSPIDTVSANLALGTPTISPSSATYDSGQSVSLTASVSGGTTPYSYQWYNDTTGTPTVISGATLSTYTATAGMTGTMKYYIEVKDSATTPETSNSTTETYIVNSVMTQPTATPATAESYDYGQNVNFNSLWTGGTPNYAYNVIVVNSITDSFITNSYNAVSSSASANFLWAFPSEYIGNTVVANVIVTDSATTPVTLNSVESGVMTLNPALVPTITNPSNTLLDAGQYVCLTASTNGGTSPFTYNFLIVQQANTNSIEADALFGSVTANSKSNCEQVQNSMVGLGNLVENTIITDSATTNVIANTIYSNPFSVNSALSNSWKVSNSLIDEGQTQVLTADTSGTGTSPYTYNFLVYNSIGSLVYNALYTGITVSSNSISFVQNSIWGAGTFTANIFITDSATTPSTTFNTLTYSTNSPLLANAVTPSSPKIDSGQSVTLTANPSGGTTPYTYQWYSGTSSTCSSDTAISGATSSTYSASPTSNTYYCYIVTDSATSPASATSGTDLVTVNSALVTPTISPSSATYDAGQSVSLTASVSGGTTPYSYQWYNDTSGSANAIPGATSATFTETAGATAQTVKYYIIVTDSATTPESTTSATDSDVVNTALSAGSVTPSSPTIDSGQSVTLTANPSGGTTPYTYQWYNGTSSTCSSDTAITGATSNTIHASPSSSTYYCYIVTDSATTPTSATSGTDLVTANLALGTPTISPPSGTYSSGQTITLNASVSGGTTPYFYQWYNDTSGSANAIPGAISSIFTEPAGATPQTVKYYVTVTDSATVNEIENSPTADISISSSSSPSTSSGTSSGPSGGSSSGGGAVGNSTNINFPGTKPQMASINDGFVVFGITPLTVFNLTLLGTKLDFVENFITNANAGITVNGKNYVLYPNQSKTISEASGEPYLYNMSIYNLSDTPVKSTIALKVIAISNLKPINITGQNETYDIMTYNAVPVQLNLLAEKTTVNITSAFTAQQRFTVRNLTLAQYLPPLPQGYNKILVQNISVKGINLQNAIPTNTTMTITMKYNCSIPFYKIFPFALSNSSWEQFTQFTVNSKSCTVSLTTGGDPIIALGRYTKITNSTPTINTSKISNHTVKRNISTHIITVNTSEVNNTTNSEYLQYNTYEYLLLAIFIAIVILSVYYYLRIKGKYTAEKQKPPPADPKIISKSDSQPGKK